MRGVKPRHTAGTQGSFVAPGPGGVGTVDAPILLRRRPERPPELGHATGVVGDFNVPKSIWVLAWQWARSRSMQVKWPLSKTGELVFPGSYIGIMDHRRSFDQRITNILPVIPRGETNQATSNRRDIQVGDVGGTCGQESKVTDVGCEDTILTALSLNRVVSHRYHHHILPARAKKKGEESDTEDEYDSGGEDETGESRLMKHAELAITATIGMLGFIQITPDDYTLALALQKQWEEEDGVVRKRAAEDEERSQQVIARLQAMDEKIDKKRHIATQKRRKGGQTTPSLRMGSCSKLWLTPTATRLRVIQTPTMFIDSEDPSPECYRKPDPPALNDVIDDISEGDGGAHSTLQHGDESLEEVPEALNDDEISLVEKVSKAKSKRIEETEQEDNNLDPDDLLEGDERGGVSASSPESSAIDT
ncbi:hypothetical protein B0H14DRAFT_3556263 [Mycena olivaceomarginata]|nr:hypothetical protein B0H14DRAFT_3556263 [Mycena olivaceomarginata]